jgi:hypothetical protein
MITVYRAAHIADAQMVVDVLALEGIEAVIIGSALTSGAGDLPMNVAPEVRVDDDDAVRARGIVEAWAAKPADAPAADAPPPSMRVNWFSALVGLLAGVVIGAAGVHFRNRAQEQSAVVDYDRDGHPEERWVYGSNGDVSRVDYDHNSDGKIDETSESGRTYGQSTVRSDNDFDGRMETVTQVWQGLYDTARIDLDGDGVHDEFIDYEFGRVKLEEYRDRASQQVTLRISYALDGTSIRELDTDGDGRMDLRRTHDRRGEILDEAPIP